MKQRNAQNYKHNHHSRENRQPAPNHFRAESYFQSLEVSVSVCNGAATDTSHSRITRRPIALGVRGLTDVVRRTFKSDPQKWLTNLVNTEKAGVAQDCWRCPKECVEKSFVFSIPIILIIETEILAGHQDRWKFPPTLDPLAHTDQKNQIKYEIVGRIFSNRSHFCARFNCPPSIDSASGLYDYDSMESKGYSLKLNGGTVKSCLTGTDSNLRDVPPGFQTFATIYRLCGGHQSQKQFLDFQMEAAKKHHNLCFSTCDLNSIPEVSYGEGIYNRVPDKDRTWMRDPYRITYADYIARPPVVPAADAVGGMDPGPESEEGQDERTDNRATLKRKRGGEGHGETASNEIQPPKKKSKPAPTASSPAKARDSSRRARPTRRKVSTVKGRNSNAGHKTTRKRKGDPELNIDAPPDKKINKGPQRAEPKPIPGNKRSGKNWDVITIPDDDEDHRQTSPVQEKNEGRQLRSASRPQPKDVEPETDVTQSKARRPANAKQHSPDLPLRSSPEDEDFQMECRCGRTGNGDREQDAEKAVRCDQCHNYSHVACQHGLFPKSGELANFECDRCCPLPQIKQRKDKWYVHWCVHHFFLTWCLAVALANSTKIRTAPLGNSVKCTMEYQH